MVQGRLTGDKARDTEAELMAIAGNAATAAKMWAEYLDDLRRRRPGSKRLTDQYRLMMAITEIGAEKDPAAAAPAANLNLTDEDRAALVALLKERLPT